MINFNRLIDLLPFYFKEKDSYKDEEGKGLLERFLELVGESLVESGLYTEGLSPLDTITQVLDLIDVDTTKPVFLDYLYELLGSPPQGYEESSEYLVYRDKPPYYIWFLKPDTIVKSFSKLGFVEYKTSQNKRPYDGIDRLFIKYAITLYKIRGSFKFYEIVLKAYFNLKEISIEEDDIITDAVKNLTYDSSALYDMSDYYDSVSTKDCQACSNLLINLSAYSKNLTDIEKQRLKNIFEKYSPINTIVQVAYEMCNVSLILDGPSLIEQDMVLVKGGGLKPKGYTTNIKVEVSLPYNFLGWYTEDNILISNSQSYNFPVEKDIVMKARYEIN